MSPTFSIPDFEITHELVRDLFAETFRVFGTDLVGLYLGGSLALGGFESDRSDLDFVVVVSDPIDSTALEMLRGSNSQIRASARNRLYGCYEGVYLTSAQAASPLAPAIVAPHLGGDGRLEIEPHGSEIVVDLWKVRRSGFVVFGPPPSQVIGEIADSDLGAAKLELFRSWWLPKVKRREPMDSGYQAYAVLTMCRFLYSLVHGGDVSKRLAANWVIGRHPTFASLVAAARDRGFVGEFDHLDAVYDLIQAVAAALSEN